MAGFGSIQAVLANLAISTIVGGLVFFIVAKLISTKLNDDIGVGKVFTAILIINLASLPLVWSLTVQAIEAIPFAYVIFPFLPFLVWFLVIRLVFKEMAVSHSLIIAILGYILSIYVVPTLVWSVRGLL